jgi:hypothetical protein
MLGIVPPSDANARKHDGELPQIDRHRRCQRQHAEQRRTGDNQAAAAYPVGQHGDGVEPKRHAGSLRGEYKGHRRNRDGWPLAMTAARLATT